MPLHVEDGSGAKLGSHEALIELRCGLDLVHQFLGDNLAGLVMDGVLGEKLGLESPVLVELREGLDEVAGHGSTAHGRIMALGQEAVKGMAELVKSGLHLVHGQESRTVLVRRGEIADIDYDRTYFLAVGIVVLVAEIVHPCAAALGRAREIVAEEDTEQGAVGIGELPGLSCVVVELHPLQTLEVHPVQGMSRLEDTLLHVLHLEVRLGQVLVKVVLGLAYLLGIIPPVPWLDLGPYREKSGLDVLVHDLLHVGNLLLRLGDGGLHDTVKELVHSLWIMGHLRLEYEGGGVVVPHQLSLLDAQAHHVEHKLAVIVLVAVVAA